MTRARFTTFGTRDRAEELPPELAAMHELDGEADAEGDFLRDLRLEEAYPLGAVPTCRDIRRGRTA